MTHPVRLPGNPPPQSPWVYEASDTNGKVIRLTVNYDNTTLAIVNVAGVAGTLFRDPECRYKHLYIGFGADGTVETTTKVFHPPAGTSTVNATQMKNAGFDTIDDIRALQITAGP